MNTDLGWRFDNSYARLPEGLFSRVGPTPVKEPQLVLFNTALAQQLGLRVDGMDPAAIAQVLVGNAVPMGSEPIAQAYAGHQFGHFTMLGDGRAVLLGEQLTPAGQRFDIQLKGSGTTPYSRRGDGRATLRAMLREYLMSEAMHHLGIPTSRSLAVVRTGQTVVRERPEQGAVLTRVAASHIRVGTFEYARHFLPVNELRALLEHTIQRHHPEAADAENPALELLRSMMRGQIALIVHWMRVGFIHGVMNTDNMGLACETFDYGPCAFMNAYDPATVFSSIDTGGRYAFGNQPAIAHWNLSVLGGALLHLIHANEDEAVALAQAVLDEFPALFRAAHLRMACAKLGIHAPRNGDAAIVQELYDWMRAAHADHTNTFTALMENHVPAHAPFTDERFQGWHARWKERINGAPGELQAAHLLMRRTNPVVIPRNHVVEQVLDAATHQHDLGPFQNMLAVLQQPYTTGTIPERYRMPPQDGDSGYRTFCGT
ncbi:MAG: YdiU family protein [Flavobacteriales bacterium]